MTLLKTHRDNQEEEKWVELITQEGGEKQDNG